MEVGERIVGGRTVEIDRRGEVRTFRPTDVDPATLAGLEVATGRWGATTVAEVLERHEARSLVVLHGDELAYEWYRPGDDGRRRNRCYSVTKSFTGTLAAIAMHDGVLDRAAAVGGLVPELAATGFGDATVGLIADMTASIAYDEDYADAVETTDGQTILGFGDYMVALGLELPDADLPADMPRSIRAFLAQVRKGSLPHGEVFAYATPTAEVLGWLLERARGVAYAELLGASLWSRIGAEHAASLSLDPAGAPMTGAGLAMTTRDLARFGLLLSEQSRPTNDPVIPSAVIEIIRDGGDQAAFQRGGHYAYLAGYSYRDQWWMPGGAGRPLSAWGIHGQVLWVDPDAQIVVATHCGGPDPSGERRDLEQDAMCRALTAALTGR